jgi:hypothetical protein
MSVLPLLVNACGLDCIFAELAMLSIGPEVGWEKMFERLTGVVAKKRYSARLKWNKILS